MADRKETFWVEVVVGAEKAISGLKKIGAAVLKLGSNFTTLAKRVLSVKNGLIALVTGLALDKFVASGADAEKVERRFIQTLRLAGERAVWTKDQFDKLSEGIIHLTNVTDDQLYAAGEVINGWEFLVKDLAPQALKLSADLSERTGSLESATTLIGKLLENPKQAVSFLRRSGVFLNEEAVNLAVSLKEVAEKSKDIAGTRAYQDLLLGTLAARVHGLAAESRTGLGSFLHMKLAVGELWENISKVAGRTLIPLFEWVSSKAYALTEAVKGNLGIGAEWRGKILDWLQAAYNWVVKIVSYLRWALDGFNAQMDYFMEVLERFEGLRVTKEGVSVKWRGGAAPARPGVEPWSEHWADLNNPAYGRPATEKVGTWRAWVDALEQTSARLRAVAEGFTGLEGSIRTARAALESLVPKGVQSLFRMGGVGPVKGEGLGLETDLDFKRLPNAEKLAKAAKEMRAAFVEEIGGGIREIVALAVRGFAGIEEGWEKMLGRMLKELVVSGFYKFFLFLLDKAVPGLGSFLGGSMSFADFLGGAKTGGGLGGKGGGKGKGVPGGFGSSLQVFEALPWTYIRATYGQIEPALSRVSSRQSRSYAKELEYGTAAHLR